MNQKLFNQDYLQHLCQQYNIIPSKKYGQNFLINPEPIQKMVQAGAVKQGDVVVEIGPGFGVLTFALAEQAKKVMAFEIEKKLESYWTEGMRQYNNIEIVWGNVLMSLRGEERRSNPTNGTIKPWDRHASLAMTGLYKVIANLPYQITSQVLRTFLEMDHKPELMVLMVQKEVAERICAPAGEMSVLSVSVQYYGEPEIIAYVPKSYFWPSPAVDSAIIKIRTKNTESQTKDATGLLFKIVKAGFASRRKMLIKNLSSVIKKSELQKFFAELGIDEKVRAQELTVRQWKDLVHKVKSL